MNVNTAVQLPNNLENLQTSLNKEVEDKANELQNAEKDELLDSYKKEIEEFLKDIPQDEWGTYDPSEIYKKIGKYEEDSYIYKELQNHLLKGILFYGEDPDKENDFSFEDSYKIKPNDSTMSKSIKLQLQVGFGISNNTIYQRAFYASAGMEVQRDLTQFLNENKIKDFELKEDIFRLPNEYADELINLFSDEEISVEDFKKEYLKIKEEIDKLENEKNKSDDVVYDTKEDKEKKKPFEAIEVKGNFKRESMQDILAKLNISKVKSDRDLLAIYLAYKDSENFYEKRV